MMYTEPTKYEAPQQKTLRKIDLRNFLAFKALYYNSNVMKKDKFVIKSSFFATSSDDVFQILLAIYIYTIL